MDRATLDRVAYLARVKLSEAEANELTQQLGSALKHFEQISKIKTDGVEPLVTPSEITSHWRADVVQKELSADEIVANAPSRQGNLFSVPPVV